MYTSQSEKGANEYQALSEAVQGKIFDTLLEKVDIKPGLKIIDIGCGTGNNSFKLSKMVGDNGMVVAIDPIKERIETARKSYGSSKNLRFEEGGAIDCWKFGTDFDLAVASVVLHWIPEQDRIKSIQGIYKCLKTDSTSRLVFAVVGSNNRNITFLQEKLSSYKQFFDNFFPFKNNKKSKDGKSGGETENLLFKDIGFREVRVDEGGISVPIPDLDFFLRWIASTVHTVDDGEALKELQDVTRDGSLDLSQLYDDNGDLVYKHPDYQYVYCTKWSITQKQVTWKQTKLFKLLTLGVLKNQMEKHFRLILHGGFLYMGVF